MAINKSTGNLTLQFPLPKAPNGQAFAQAAIYDLTAASSTPQFVENVVITNPANFSYTMPGYSVTTLALTAGSASVWSAAGYPLVSGGSWSLAGNWTGGVPNAVGAIAAINAPTTAAATITLDKPQTIGLLELGNSASPTVGYTLSGTGTNTLTFNNAGNGATIAVTDGTHAINAPVVLADNLQVTGNNSGWTLSFGGAPSGSGSITGGYGLTMGGNGTLILSGQNTYTGVTTLTSGILNLGSAENAGTSGPLGKSAAANPGSIVFNGGTLQYSASNTNDYSGRFSTAANQPYSVDTNGQNVTWATALTASGGSLAKIGNGTLTLAAADNFAVANVSGGGVAVSGGTIGAFNLNTGAGTSSIGAGAAVTTLNVSAGGVAVSGGTIGAFNLNTGAGASTIGAGAAVTTLNVSAGGVAVSGGTIGAFNLNTGAGTSTIGAGAAVATTTVNAGTVNFNSTQPNGILALPAASTGTVIVGPAMRRPAAHGRHRRLQRYARHGHGQCRQPAGHHRHAKAARRRDGDDQQWGFVHRHGRQPGQHLHPQHARPWRRDSDLSHRWGVAEHRRALERLRRRQLDQRQRRGWRRAEQFIGTMSGPTGIPGRPAIW